eukprot:TRINITY_DN1123_c0_g1_i1.p1 TRINITY_DN1123_c0_g1~~TRINITY_DN1123_c0_g1_i1.p1  ORF type:complete len:160 (+),score=52.24 TRINITY_DN1123_c0_g1_i1:148-627(+)
MCIRDRWYQRRVREVTPGWLVPVLPEAEEAVVDNPEEAFDTAAGKLASAVADSPAEDSIGVASGTDRVVVQDASAEEDIHIVAVAGTRPVVLPVRMPAAPDAVVPPRESAYPLHKLPEQQVLLQQVLHLFQQEELKNFLLMRAQEYLSLIHISEPTRPY